MAEPARGELWLTNFDSAPPAIGHEQAGRRSALVLSDTRFNAGLSGLVVVIPLTRRIRAVAMHVTLTSPEGGLRAPSAILCDQIRAVSRQRLIERWGNISPGTMQEVATRVRLLLRL